MLGVSMRLPEAVDMGKALTIYVQSNYAPAELSSVSKAIQDVHQMRAKICQSIVRNEADHANSIDFFLQYYYTLLSLSARFPFGNQVQSSLLGFKSGKVPSVRCLFSWYDSFRHSNKVSDYDISFEKSSVLFDIAALYSRQATQVKASATAKDDGPIKEACRLFQLSSGVFEFLSRSVELGAAAGLSVDLSQEGLQMLAKLMLAQSMACFFEKATFSASPKLVAKLAMGVSDLFKQTYALCEKPRIKGLAGRNDVYAWETHCYYQMICYQAASHYWLAKGLISEDNYGEEIAHLEKARILLEGAQRIEVSLLKNLTENRQRLDSAIKTRLAAAIKDNDTIYYSQVPKQDAVKDPEAVVTVKPTPFEIKMEHKDDPFSCLVSPAMKLQSSEFKVKLNELIASTTKSVQEASDYTKMHLSSLNLPAALEALEPATGLTDDLWNQISDVQSKGGEGALEDLNRHITIYANDADTGYQNIVTILNNEKADDQQMRKEFNQRWNRKPSEQLTVAFTRDLETIHKFLVEAEKSNKKVRTEWEQNKIKLKILSASRSSIESRLPSMNQEAKTETSETLRILLDAVSTQLDRKTKLVKDMETAMNSVNIIPTLIANKDRPSDQIYAAELSKFDTYTKQIDDLNKQQEEILASVTQASEAFEKTRVNKNDDTMVRTNIIQEINVGVQLFSKLLSNFNEGARFYKDLMGQRIQPLKQRVDDFVLARNEEKKMVLEQLHRELQTFRDQEAALSAALANAGIRGQPQHQQQQMGQPQMPQYDSHHSAPLGPSGLYAQVPMAHPVESSAPPADSPYSAYQPYNPPAGSYASASAPSSSSSAYNPFFSAPPVSAPSSASAYQPYTSSGSSVNPFLAASTPSISPTNPSYDSSSSAYSSSASSGNGGYPTVGTTTSSSAGGAKEEAKPGQWSCSSCTYLNDKAEKKCVMCDAAAPADGAVAAPAAGTEEKKKGLFGGLFGKK